MKTLRSLVLTLGLGTAVLAPATVRASDPMSFHADDEEIVVEFTGVTPAEDRVTARGDKLTLRIDGWRAGVHGRNAADPLIKRIAIVGGDAPRVLAVVRGSSRAAARLAERTKIERTEDGFRLVIARRAATAAPVAPEEEDAPPASEPEPAASPLASAVAAEPAHPTPAATDPTASPFTLPPAPEAEASSGAASVSSGETPSDRGLGLGTLVALGLVLVAGGTLLVARKAKLPWLAQIGIGKADTPIRIEGSAPLSGRTRAVLVAIADRRILVAIGEGGTSVLDRWNADGTTASPETAPAGGFDAALDRAWQRARDEASATPPAVATASSPAVAGLLELRRRAKARRSFTTSGASNPEAAVR